MLFFRKFIKPQHLLRTLRRGSPGNLTVSLTMTVLFVMLSVYLGNLLISSTQVAQKKIKNLVFTNQFSSTVETLMVAYRNSEKKYSETIANSGCTSGNPFLTALKSGSGCASVGPITVFYNGDPDDPGAALYKYLLPNGAGTGCTIGPTSSTCTGPFLEIDGKNPQAPFSDSVYDYSITTVSTANHIVEMLGTVTDSTGKVSKQAFAIIDTLRNIAHLEAEGRVTQENPDPLYSCPGTPWGDYLIFDPSTRTCKNFAQLGGGTGLAFYANRYFGLRPFDGQIVDLTAASLDTSAPSSSFFVKQDGTAATTTPIFPCYSKEAFTNVDDITLIQNDLFYVAGQGDSAVIGGVSIDQKTCSNAQPTYTKGPICNLGAQGWSQAYAGIAATSWSDPLVTMYNTHATRKGLATFVLKTDAGDLLTAIVIYDPAGTFSCFVTKDATKQQVEYKRTYGFERTDNIKPYYIY